MHTLNNGLYLFVLATFDASNYIIHKCLHVMCSALYAFSVYDSDRSDTMDTDETNTMLKDIYGMLLYYNVWNMFAVQSL